MSTVPHRNSTQHAHLSRLIKKSTSPKIEITGTFGILAIALSRLLTNSYLLKHQRAFGRYHTGALGLTEHFLSCISGALAEAQSIPKAWTSPISTKLPLLFSVSLCVCFSSLRPSCCSSSPSLSGLSVASLSRSGRSSLHDPWANNVTWHKGNLISPESLKDALDDVTSVISCVGGFGSNSYMYKINGTANINAIRAASEQGVKRFVYVSTADFGVVNYLLRGYYKGKRAAETELLTKFPYGGVILRHGLINN
ncbi:hypothetical protein L3X38_012178 [Prunus dulcis]|uniref:NAD(P)-binding domain-containing protein n=1 Tax=Prunus dulcis TaxID=3755 RepID=A0AAD4ZG47_PRUDU|nr:hypothetical protein L3X38_012178 [Prunus dulcis]